MDHIVSNCPLKGRRSKESQSPDQPSNNSGNKTVNNIVVESKELQQDMTDLNKANVVELLIKSSCKMLRGRWQWLNKQGQCMKLHVLTTRCQTT